jgi:hypothetical protein
MTPHPDKLFQDRLEHYRKVAPASAWDRIESDLEHKRNRSPWLKIAAGLLFLFATTTIIFQLSQTDNTIATVDNKSAAKKEQESDISFHKSSDVSRGSGQSSVSGPQSSVNSGQSSVSSPQLAVGSKQSSVSSPQSSVSIHQSSVSSGQSSASSPQLAVGSKQSSVSSAQSSVSSPQSSVSSGQSSTYTQTIEPVETKNEQPVAQAEITNEFSPTNEALNSKGTSITYSAEEVNAKYLKKESPSEATPEKKNTSGLQKVIDLALDLKSEGTVLGELREKKNELLSFNAPPSKRELNK